MANGNNACVLNRYFNFYIKLEVKRGDKKFIQLS